MTIGKKIFLCLLLITGGNCLRGQPQVAFSFDDPSTAPGPYYSWQQRNGQLLQTLQRHHITATLFVCGKRVGDSAGTQLLDSWNRQGHLIANHSYGHHYYHSKTYDTIAFRSDLLQNDSLIAGFSSYTRLFRFPYLKEGDTKEKRDAARRILQAAGYRQGYVTIDASDWYIDRLLADTLQKNPGTNPDLYRKLYIRHILERAAFYETLAYRLTGRHIKHTLLLHHNLVNALFLDDLITAFREQNWVIIAAKDAWTDPVYALEPDNVPAGESIIWAMAKASGKYEAELRYPGEDSVYEEEKFKQFIRSSGKP